MELSLDSFSWELWYVEHILKCIPLELSLFLFSAQHICGATVLP